ncbi:MAG: hypothetical protein M3417_07765 [Actinomycetota bacterium]|nr:hypothetical protein [Actinomycetota bacterium]
MVAIAVVALVVGGIATISLVETNTFATVALVMGAVVLLLIMALMTMLVSFLKDLQSKATKLLEAHPTGRDLDTTRGLLDSLRELEVGARAVRDTSIDTSIDTPIDTPIAPDAPAGGSARRRRKPGIPVDPDVERGPSGARDDPTP